MLTKYENKAKVDGGYCVKFVNLRVVGIALEESIDERSCLTDLCTRMFGSGQMKETPRGWEWTMSAFRDEVQRNVRKIKGCNNATPDAEPGRKSG